MLRKASDVEVKHVTTGEMEFGSAVARRAALALNVKFGAEGMFFRS